MVPNARARGMTPAVRHAMRLLLVEPDTAYLDLIKVAARQAGLDLEHWPSIEAIPRGAISNSEGETLVGLGPSISRPVQAACVLQGLVPRDPVLIFRNRGDEAAEGSDQGQIGRDDRRWEVVLLAEPGRLAVTLRRVADRSIHQHQHRRDVESMARQVVETSEHYLASVLAQANDAIVSTDVQGVVRTWNAAATRLFGVTSERARGKTFEAVERASAVTDVTFVTGFLGEVVQRVIHTRRAEQVEVEWANEQREAMDLSASVAPIRDSRGELLGVSIIARNITQRRRAEEALREANRQKDQFLAMMSHELRTPLTTILGYTDMMLRGLGGPLAPRGNQYMGSIRTASLSLLGLVEGLLDYSQLESGAAQLHLQPLDISDVVERSIDRVRPLALPKQIQMEARLADPGPVLGDSAKLQQILGNYLSNAVKFTTEGGQVVVLSEPERDDAGFVRIGVRDSGIGLEPEQVEQVWDRFYQVDSSSYTRQYGGLGLGLAIVRHLAHLHRGRAWAESEGPGRGSTFWVTLPRA